MPSFHPSPRRLFRGSFLRFSALLLAGGLLAGSMAGCYGRFPLTNAFYRWNGEVTDNHVVNSIIMVVLGFVYSITTLVDVLIINSIEFWSGDQVNVAKTWQEPDGTTITMAPGANGNEAIVTIHRDGELLEERTYLRQADGTTQVLDGEANLLATVHPDGQGGFTFSDSNGGDLGALSADNVREFAAAQ